MKTGTYDADYSKIKIIKEYKNSKRDGSQRHETSNTADSLILDGTKKDFAQMALTIRSTKNCLTSRASYEQKKTDSLP